MGKKRLHSQVDKNTCFLRIHSILSENAAEYSHAMTNSVLWKTGGDEDDALLVLLSHTHDMKMHGTDSHPCLKGSVSHTLHGRMDFPVRLSGSASDPFGALENRLTSKTSYLSILALGLGGVLPDGKI